MRVDNFRAQPRIWHVDYPTLRTNRKIFEIFRSRVSDHKDVRLLDIGCGQKPYALLFKNLMHYGTDLDLHSALPDAVARNERLPFPDSTFDAVIASETLEHTLEYEFAVQEIRRITKDRGLLFISVPFVHPIHDHPYDFQRITEYKFFDLFGLDEFVEFHPSNTIFSTWVITLEQAIVMGLSFAPVRRITIPITALILNTLALGIDLVATGMHDLLIRIPGVRKRLDARIMHKRGSYGALTSMPGGYAMVIQINNP
jgi:SAM-dependent methyltransferase